MTTAKRAAREVKGERGDGRLPALLFHRGIEWTSAVQGSTSVLARLFAREGYPVTWLSRPQNLISLRRGHEREKAVEPRVFRGDDGVLCIRPRAIFPRISRLPRTFNAPWNRLAYRCLVPSLREAIQRAGQPLPDLIWTAGGDAGELRALRRGSVRVMQCVDNYSAYSGGRQEELEALDYRDADVVVAIGEATRERLLKSCHVSPEKVVVIGQGAPEEFFERPEQEPEALANCPRPRAVWLGVVEKADEALIRRALAAVSKHNGSLIIIGAPTPWAERLQTESERVRLLGALPGKEAAKIVAWCDLGLMLYDQSRPPGIYQCQHPLKLYEYAAASLAIIATPHREFELKRVPALVVRTPAETEAAIADAVSRRDALGNESRRFAEANRWTSRFREAQSLVERLLRTAGSGIS